MTYSFMHAQYEYSEYHTVCTYDIELEMWEKP